jgi:hypothetical protein
MEFDFNTVEESKSNFKERLKPGIHVVMFLGIKEESTVEPGKNPWIEVSVSNETGEHTERGYTNSDVKAGKKRSAQDITLGNLKHIATKVVPADVLATVKNITDLGRVLTGKKFALKLRGEETLKTDGVNTFIKAKWAFPPFAASPSNIDDLSFDPKYDIKYLEKTGEMVVIGKEVDDSTLDTEKPDENLPF